MFRFPFDWTTPFGYSMAWSIEGISAISTVLMGAPPLCFLIGACTLLSAFAKDITNDLVNFSAITIASKHSIQALTIRFSNILQMYADIKQLSYNMKIL